MPHAGLMDEQALGQIAGPLQRARLHIRGGKRRLRQGKLSAGIVTLYDALEAALEWYTAAPEHRKRLGASAGDARTSSRGRYARLRDAGVLDGTFDFDAFDRLTERALESDLGDYDYGPLLKDFQCVMTQLGVMPFDESSLPAEDPSTF